ncbi:glycosylphosphatidylinositol-mannosyltransferase 1 [Geosmithia morbida]|uniref:Protein PBN1 n=1 Tax=Geosmithia morbida TaxID=1094350 RepID=A0A9P4YUU1_9HYPO|nr:glycosylphosphatidylinositol-mannosyltransferase 1 [Geosmithia morbida]KAF4123210.1 glycosylphosphatidylinositol-mannosyltransferase 1 [Geosmithia morbida]
MRERITLVHRPESGIDPDALTLDKSGLKAPSSIEAVREDRLTVTLDTLTHELAQLLQDFDVLRVRWASPVRHQTLEPFSSRLSPGLHVSYTPSSSETPHDPSRLCAFLRALGPLDCMSHEAFTISGSPDKPDYYFYQPMLDIEAISRAFETDLCRGHESCRTRAGELKTAASVDFTFDKGTEVSKLSALWPLSEQQVDFVADPSHRVEVGILTRGEPPSLGRHDVGMSGLLAVLGERKTPSPTLFKFASRHRTAAAHFTSRFLAPTGLHPTLQISLDGAGGGRPPSSSSSEEDGDGDGDGDGACKPYAFLTLPKTIFADRYQLDDQLFLASKNLTAARHMSHPVDLEAPAYTTTTWGSNLLVEMAAPGSDGWTVEVPLHLRYLEPSATGERDVAVPYPVVFWACERAAEGTALADNPFDRTGLGYDQLFSPDTVFWHVEPRPAHGAATADIVNHIAVPVLREEAASWVGAGTAAVVSLGFAWVLWKLATLYASVGYKAGAGDDKKRQ